MNINLRQKATNEFDISLHKLFVNAVFGKTMENFRNYADIKLCFTSDGRYGASKYIPKTYFKEIIIFDEELIAVTMNKRFVLFNKPIYIGMCILDHAKKHLFAFHYNVILKELKGKAKLLYTDTNSLIYEIECDSIYDFMKCNIDKFDTSNYQKNNIYNIPLINIKVMGLMKDES